MRIKVRTVDQEYAKQNLEENKNIILLDVRTVEEYKEIHIPGSILIPLDEITKENMEKKIPDKQALIYIHCRSGGRSKIAYGLLRELGYTNMYDIGGINTWSYETERG
ncbi:MAG TPA: rhodanese-like domain-containing protein [Clostridiales bacterium]|nr:rhodanese-like domain-containing protein [Clostridiales bacterium]